MTPFEMGRRRRAAQATASFDVPQFLRIGTTALRWITVGRPPDEAKQDPHYSYDDEQCAPPEVCGHPEQNRAEKRKSEVLPHSVDAGGARPLRLREPNAENSTVTGIRGCFRDPEREPRANQRS